MAKFDQQQIEQIWSALERSMGAAMDQHDEQEGGEDVRLHTNYVVYGFSEYDDQVAVSRLTVLHPEQNAKMEASGAAADKAESSGASLSEKEDIVRNFAKISTAAIAAGAFGTKVAEKNMQAQAVDFANGMKAAAAVADRLFEVDSGEE